MADQKTRGNPLFSFFIDRGGTFTDCLCVSVTTGKEWVIKVLSENPGHYESASLECVRVGLEFALQKPFPRGTKLPNEYIDEIRIGTTIATNALLERQGNAFGYVTTRGFKDLLLIGQQSRPDIFDLRIETPPTLFQEVVEIDERVVLVSDDSPKDIQPINTVSGQKVFIRKPLPSDAQIEAQLRKVKNAGLNSLAVAFMHSAVYPDHELRVGAIAKRMGFEHVSLSHQAMQMVRIVARGNTACADAYLTPKILAFVHSFLNGFQDPASTRVLFMRSDGGLEEARSFSGHRAILSGPAGGVNGFSRTAYSEKERRPVVGFDMGGTSTDVSRFHGEFDHVFETTTAGITIQAPQLEINTVAAGGGSRLFFRNGMFQVGPESAGSKPGPICYRRENGLLAITDANLILGRLVPSEFPKVFGPNENEAIDPIRTRQAFESLRQEHKALAGMSCEDIALGYVRVANEAMCRPIREMTMMRGFDVQEHILASFGGAGGQHACAIAKALGISKVRIHRYAGILSAVGLGLAEIVQEAQEPAASETLSNTLLTRLNTRLDQLETEARNALETKTRRGQINPNEMVVERFFHLRYMGTETTVPISHFAVPSITAENLKVAFERHHRREFGFTLENRVLLCDDIRVNVRLKSKFQLMSETDSLDSVTAPLVSVVPGHRTFFDNLGWVSTGVFRVEEVVGRRIEGPAILLQGISTIVVEPNCTAVISRHGDVEIDIGTSKTVLSQQQALIVPTTPDPIQLSLYSHRFMSIAEQMGRTLRRTAVSVNIKERLDYSCALFGPDGGLVAHAPYIPVHLGAMSSAVRAQIRFWGSNITEGDVFVSNHPTLAGGSHLPDITVIEPAFHDGKVVFWVASRGHHSDIGGISPGSMPPHSSLLAHEGTAIVAFKLVSSGVFDEEGITKLLTTPTCPESFGTRNLKDNISDLKAQVAANRRGVELVRELVRERSLPVVNAYMSFIREHCDRCVKNLIRAKSRDMGDVLEANDFMDDGSEICLKIRLDAKLGRATFDFTGTDLQVSGNWNSPPAVTYSAIVYCLRCMIGEDIPLNEGCLSSVDVILPKNSLLDPSPTAAVVGGNVLTSQRLCDIILKAFAACAASQGCMNNLTLGDDRFGYYETICGGAGAGPDWDGKDAVHTHMTNTRIGDPEIIEKRFPLIVRMFGIRDGSGGQGQFRGGNGCVRELEFLRPVTVSILSERRSFAPFGMNGGEPGKRGRNYWFSTQEKQLRSVGAKNSFKAEAGDFIRIESPGGGGWGRLRESSAVPISML